MKTKLLFTAALMSATMMTPQLKATSALEVQEKIEMARNGVVDLEEVADGVDYTSYVINSSCSEWWTGWVRNVVNETGGYVVENGEINSDVYQGKGIEFWSPFSEDKYANKELIFQTVTNLPYGRYKVSAVATGRNQNNNNINDGQLYFFANEATTDVTSTKFQSVELESPVGFEGLKIGLAGGENNKNHWVALSNVKLTLLNNETSLNDAIAAAKNLRENIIKELDNNDFNTAISNAEAVGSGKTSEEYKTALETLNKAVTVYISTCVSETDPLDLSKQIDNLGLNDSRIDGWIDGGVRPVAFYNGGTEYYNTNTLIHRKLNNLIPGKYRIKVQARCNRKDLVLFAESGVNTAECNVDQGTKQDDSTDNRSVFQENVDEMNELIGNEDTWTSVDISVVDGTLDFGLRVNSGRNGWSVLNEFKLEYLGMDVLWNELIEKSNTVDVNLLPDAIKNNFENAKNKENPSYADVKALDEAIVLANSAVEPYARFKERYTVVETYNNETLANEEDELALSDKLNEAKTLVGTTLKVSDIEQAYTELLDAVKAYSKSVYDLAEGIDKTDVTFLLNNMDMSSNYVDPWKKDVVNHKGDNFRAMAPNPNDLELNIRFIECYINTANVAECGNQNLVYQDVTDMPVGKYSFKAATFNRRAWFGGSEEPNAIKLFLNDASVDVNSQKFEYNEVIGGSNDGTLSFGIRSGAQFNTDWNGIGDTHLYYLGASDDIALDENKEEMGIEDTYGNVTVERSLKADEKWNTFCVPFAMTAEQLDANKITDVRKLVSTEEKDGSVVLNFSDRVTEIEAGVPYIVKVSEAVSQITVNGVAVKVAEPAPLEVGSVNMLGNYGKINITGYDKYFISENKFYRAADKNIIVKGFRAYITMDQAAAGVNQMLINIDGNVTAIEDVLGEDVDATVNVYTIDGVCVKSGVKSSEALDGLRKGIYIVNGKKVVK